MATEIWVNVGSGNGLVSCERNPKYLFRYYTFAITHQTPLCKHIEAETKGMPFRRRYFQMQFLEWKRMNFAYDFT